jgi:predicted exporter
MKTRFFFVTFFIFFITCDIASTFLCYRYVDSAKEISPLINWLSHYLSFYDSVLLGKLIAVMLILLCVYCINRKWIKENGLRLILIVFTGIGIIASVNNLAVFFLTVII